MADLFQRQRVWVEREKRLKPLRKQELDRFLAAYDAEIVEALKAPKSRDDGLDNSRHADAKRERTERLNAIVARRAMEEAGLRASFAPPELRDGFFAEIREIENFVLAQAGRLTTEEFIEKLTKKCPKCRVVSRKEDGCNHVICPQCGCHYCWHCGKPRDERPGRCECARVDLTANQKVEMDVGDGPVSENELNLNDLTYYPPPITAELKPKCLRFMRSQKGYSTHKANKESDLRDREQTKATILGRLLLERPVEADPRELVERLYVVFDRARNVIMWSYPAVYLAPAVNRPRMENSQSYLEMRLEAVASIIFHYRQESYHQIHEAVTKLEEHVAYLIEDFLKCPV
jgi:hypothetical protein